ncbi:MAG: anti-sigma factor [Actinobacteria bacterium]|nr:anti-sigma factor [Actinomycetota bacterium]
MKHSEIESLLGAYALDAVDVDEADAVERHLRDCPRCRAEVEQHRETAAALAHGGADAPTGVWDRIAADIDTRDAPPPPQLGGETAAPTRVLHPGSGRARGPLSLVAMAAAVLAVVLVAGLGYRIVDQGRRIDRLAGSVQDDGVRQAALAARVDPAARPVALRADDGRPDVHAVVGPDGGGYVVDDNLPALSADRTYQLWAMVGDRPVSAGVLGPDPGVAAFRAPAGLGALAITRESAGGAVSPSEQPLVLAFV